MAKKIVLAEGNKKVVINLGDKIEYTSYRSPEIFPNNAVTKEVVVIKKAGKVRGVLQVTEEVRESTWISLDGSLAIQGEKDWHNENRCFSYPFDGRNGYKVTSENTWEYYSETELAYQATIIKN